MKLTGAEIVVQSLLKENVTHLFGYPGAVVVPILHHLHDAPIKFILSRHEQGAIHAADGYARSCGRPGIVLATSGPGATNLVTGLATAFMDSTPMVVITGQVSTDMIGNDAFQEVDIIGITRPITKHNYLVKDIRDLATTIKEAFYIATTGRPGPVLIDIPVNISTAATEFKYPEKITTLPGYKPTYEGHPGQIKKACKMIAKAKKPVIYAGGGIILSDASKELTQFVKKTKIPITTTMMGLGCFPETDKQSLQMLGMHGTYYANYAMHNSDVVIAIGSRFDDRVTGKIANFIPNAKVIHIDIDPASVSKNQEVDIPIVGDCKLVLEELNKQITSPNIENWNKELQEIKENNPLTYEQTKNIIKPQFVIEEIYKLTKGKALICTEVGQHQMWATQFYKYTQPRSFISSGGLGTMGFGLPAALGAQLAQPQKRVICIAGDGSIQMNIQELIIAVQHKLPVIIAILNNSFLGMVRQWQQLFYDKRYAQTCLEFAPDFVKLAEAYGAKGFRVDKAKEVDAVIEEALKIKDGPVIIDFRVAREENVYPMIPSGKTINETIMREMA